jgi:hypothetical protein
VNGQASKAEIYDVFMCHDNEDKAAVGEIAVKLLQENIKAWLDEADIVTGSYWHAVIGILSQSRSRSPQSLSEGSARLSSPPRQSDRAEAEMAQMFTKT